MYACPADALGKFGYTPSRLSTRQSCLFRPSPFGGRDQPCPCLFCRGASQLGWMSDAYCDCVLRGSHGPLPARCSADGQSCSRSAGQGRCLRCTAFLPARPQHRILSQVPVWQARNLLLHWLCVLVAHCISAKPVIRQTVLCATAVSVCIWCSSQLATYLQLPRRAASTTFQGGQAAAAGLRGDGVVQ